MPGVPSLVAEISTLDFWLLTLLATPFFLALFALALPALTKRIGGWQQRRRARRTAVAKLAAVIEDVAQLKEDMADVLVALKGRDDPISGHHSPGLVDTLDAISTLVGPPRPVTERRSPNA